MILQVLPSLSIHMSCVLTGTGGNSDSWVYFPSQQFCISLFVKRFYSEQI